MDFQLTIGETLEKEYIVLPEHSAAHLGSGTAKVLSTPSMILFMEQTARIFLETKLTTPYSSVGIEVNVKHKKAIKIGEKVRSKTVVKEQDRKKITFEVAVLHGNDIVGEGTHIRFIVNEQEFIARL